MKFFFGMPSKGLTNSIPTTSSITDMTKCMVEKGYDFNFGFASKMWVDHARNKICEAALDWGADWIGMCDEDMQFPGDVFHRLIQNDVDVCVPLMHVSGYPYNPVVFECLGEENNRIRYRPILKLKRRLIECDAVGAGVLLIRASILKDVLQPWFKTGQAGTTTEGLGEDVYFCRNVRRHGFKVHYDGRLQATHFGDPVPVNTNWVLKLAPAPGEMHPLSLED